jgi:hypothetical protein
VANYGVGGYGTDQSYLRFHYNTHDEAKIIIIGFSSDDIRRNVNQLRNLIVPEKQFGIKPRFILSEGDKLQLVPIPNLTKKDYENLIINPKKYLAHDYFIPGGLSGRIEMNFPFCLRVTKLSKYVFKRIINGKPGYEEFYDPDHPSEALNVTANILKAFYQEAKIRGKYPIVLLIPIMYDIRKYQREHIWVYQTLIDKLAENNLEFLNFGNAILAYLSQRDPRMLFTKDSHLDEEGSRVLARYVFDYLNQKNIIGGGRKISANTPF